MSASILFFCTFLVITLHAFNLPSGFKQTLLADELDSTFVKYSPDGRLFVCQKTGLINVIKDGIRLPEPFLDLIDITQSKNEKGLQGLALHPEFESNGYFYVYYADASLNRNRVIRFAAAGDVANKSSLVEIITLDPMAADTHNGGAMFFYQKKLFITTGDGSKPEESQKTTSLLGKVLRINDDGSIPTDNPFYETAIEKNKAIYALGFRNPHNAAVDSETGEILIGDVGSRDWEEVNRLVPGGNYGWPQTEGKLKKEQTPPFNYQDPIYAYKHENGFCAITGTAFYNPKESSFPSDYIGKAFFADYCRGDIQVLDTRTGEVMSTFISGTQLPVSLEVDPSGRFYYLTRRGSGKTSGRDTRGQLFVVEYTGNGNSRILISVCFIILAILGFNLLKKKSKNSKNE